MEHLLPQPRKSDMVAFFQRHVVAIYVHFERAGQHHAVLISAFVVSVRGQWLLFTAGHCVKDVEVNLRNGWTIPRSRLIDTLGSDARFSFPIPFDYLEATPTALCVDEKNDYGLLFVRDNVQRLLASNGVVPLTEEVWEKQPSEPDGFFMTGIVGELSAALIDKARVTAVVLGVDEVVERPACFEATDAFRWYGRARMPAEGLTSLIGMSGGPIFSFKVGQDGVMRYWLHAIQSVQSARFPQDPHIAANLAFPAAGFLAEVMEGKVELDPQAIPCP